MHVDAVLKLMSVMTGDPRFEEVQRRGEVNNMCEVLDRVEQRGEQRGIRKGQLNELVSLVKDGLLSQSVAAKRAKLSVTEFEKLLRA